MRLSMDMLYQRFIRPLLFTLSADTVHTLVSGSAETIARVPGVARFAKKYFRPDFPELAQVIKGIRFTLPVGLSAGFDKNAQYVSFADMFGFGFSEIGSVTGAAYKGNDGPHVRRLIASRSLVINYGLASDGVLAIEKRLQRVHPKIPIGISVAKSNLPEYVGERAVQDYVAVFKKMYPYADYLTINISCPNTFDGTPFTDGVKCEQLLSRIAIERNAQQRRKMVFVKINPDIDRTSLDGIISLVNAYDIDGFVIGNLIKNGARYAHTLTDPSEYNPAWPGGLSGDPVRAISTECIRYVFKKTEGKKIIIGCGGIFTGDDAYEKICAGATLCQLITAFIFQGPLTLRRIHIRLHELLVRDGFSHVHDAIGSQA